MNIKYCIYSIRRSGRHIVEEFLRKLGYIFCNCGIDDETVTKECYTSKIHLKHETPKNFNFSRVSKCVFLYRKDIVEQFDAITRLVYNELMYKKMLNTTEEHVSCLIPSNISVCDFLSTSEIKSILRSCNVFYRHIDENKDNRNCLFVDFDSLVYEPKVQLKKIAKFLNLNHIDDITLDDIINEHLPTLANYSKKRMSYPSYIKLLNTVKNVNLSNPPSVYNFNRWKITQKKLLVVSHGGSATTSFMKFIKDYIPTNCPKDSDGLKHAVPSKTELYNPSHIIYIYGDMDKTIRSLFKRKVVSARAYKLKNIDYSANLPILFEDLNNYTTAVVEKNIEPVGCLVHMREWKKVPNVFFIHCDQISTSESIDNYLDIPKGTCSKFRMQQITPQIEPCETPEYLETMKGLDLRVQGIVSGYNHKTNILIVSFPRSGFHLFRTIFQSYFSIKECACQKNRDVKIKTCVKEDVAFHRAHDMTIDLDKTQFNKTIILYRKDVVEQLDAFFRYQFREFDTSKEITDLNDHIKCDIVPIPYSEKLDFFRRILKQYAQWIKKWVKTPTPDSIIIEYSDFMKNPQETLDKVQEHMLGNIDSDLSSKIVQEMKIEYKHSMNAKKYKELTNLLLSLN